MCLQEECRSLKEQVAMDNDTCMVVLLTAKCVQMCVYLCVYMCKMEQGIVARSIFLQSVFWVILVLRHCRYDFLGMERGMSETAFSNLLDCKGIFNTHDQ